MLFAGNSGAELERVMLCCCKVVAAPELGGFLIVSHFPATAVRCWVKWSLAWNIDMSGGVDVLY